MNCSASIVYSNSWLGQTGNIASFGSPLTIFTPTSGTLLRLNAAATSAGGNTGVGVILNGDALSFGSAASEYTSFVFAGNAGSPVTLYTTYGSGTYDIFITIEQLQ